MIMIHRGLHLCKGIDLMLRRAILITVNEKDCTYSSWSSDFHWDEA